MLTLIHYQLEKLSKCSEAGWLFANRHTVCNCSEEAAWYLMLVYTEITSKLLPKEQFY
jgi:hypothetical protein